MAAGQNSTPLALIPEDGFVLEFPHASTAQAGLYAATMEDALRDSITDAGVSCHIDRIRINPEALDLGTVVAVMGFVSALMPIATGIWKWFAQSDPTTSPTIKIKTKDGHEISIEQAESRDLANIIRAFESVLKLKE